MGSGTHANDQVAAQLSLLEGKGLVLFNGEFGLRLTDHAKRFNLDFNKVEKDWGDTFDYDDIASKLDQDSYRWLWFVHCETSTGVLNELETLKKIRGPRKVLLCADCISSLGAVETDLGGVYLADAPEGIPYDHLARSE